MAFTPFSVLRNPSVQAILRPQVSNPSPTPALPPAPSAFFRHTFSAASLFPTSCLPPPPPPPQSVTFPPTAPANPPPPPPPANTCTDILPASLPRDLITSIPFIPAPCRALVPVSPVKDVTSPIRPLLTFSSIESSLRSTLSGGAPTPFSSIFEALSTTIHRDTLAAPLVEAVASPLRDSMVQFPYTTATQHREFLNRAGIPVSQFGTKSHPHPVHKTIEINLLHNVWKHYASPPASVLFMKPSKFPKLQKENLNFTELHNYRPTPKDTVRYPKTSHSLPPYTQPRSALLWLRTTTIQDSNLILSVSILDSWGPVHSLLIQRGLPPSCPTHDTATFRAPDAILLPEPNSLRLDARHRVVPSEVYHSPFVPETRRPLHLDLPSASVSPTAPSEDQISAPNPEPTYPGESFETVASTFAPAFDPEAKETIFRDQSSNQFPCINQPFLLLSSRLGVSSSSMPISAPNESESLQESQSSNLTLSDPQFSHIHAFTNQHPSAQFHQPRPFLSGAGSMDSLSALIPLLTELLSHLNSNESTPSSDPVAPDVLPGGSSASRLVRPPKLQAPARSLTSPALLKGPSIQLPFQFIYYDITGVEKGMNSIDISGKDILLSMMKPYSHARLVSLEAVVFPYSASLTYPQTFDAVWSTADAVISGSDIISTYGSQRVTFGGPISSSVQITIPADLTSLNPVIRDSVTYKDTPKLNVAFYQNPDNVALGVSKAVICGSVVIRGVLEVSSVRPSPSKA